MGEDLPRFGGHFLADEEQHRENDKFIGNSGHVVSLVKLKVKDGRVVVVRLIRMLNGKVYVRL